MQRSGQLVGLLWWCARPFKGTSEQAPGVGAPFLVHCRGKMHVCFGVV